MNHIICIEETDGSQVIVATKHIRNILVTKIDEGSEVTIEFAGSSESSVVLYTNLPPRELAASVLAAWESIHADEGSHND